MDVAASRSLSPPCLLSKASRSSFTEGSSRGLPPGRRRLAERPLSSGDRWGVRTERRRGWMSFLALEEGRYEGKTLLIAF